MSRILKFRAWDEKNKKMWYFDLEAYVNDQDSEFGTFCIPREEEGPRMQFTGLLDKNGKEIYEGDVIRRHHYAVEPMSKEERKRLGVLGGAIVHPSLIEGTAAYDEAVKVRIPDVYQEDRRLDEFEVIGNIYENPELIPNRS